MGYSLSIRGIGDAIADGEHDAARAIGRAMTAAGHEAAGAARTLLNRLPGGMKIGNRVVGRARTPKVPHRPGELGAPHPGDFPILTRDGKGTVCGNLDAWGGSEPFALVGFKSLAAGAQTQGTDLIDFHASASNPTWITTDDLIPGNVEVFEASLYIGPRLTTTLGFEGPAFLNSGWIIEYINGIEKARWSLKQLATLMAGVGVITSGGVGYAQPLDLPSIPWHRKYDPNVKAKTALQISVTTTTVSALDASFVETGVRP